MSAQDSIPAKNFKDLIVWQKGMDIAKVAYKLTASFPVEKRLVNQMRRAAVSIPSNIAEGQARHTTGEFVQSISHAEGSLAELETQARLSVELKFVSVEAAAPFLDLLNQERKMLNTSAASWSTVLVHSSPVTSD